MPADRWARAWAASGAMALTGHPGGPPVAGPPLLPERIRATTAAIARRTGGRVDLDWGRLVAGRAGLLGFRRRGRTSAGGSCRLLRADDGAWVAVNLPRREDVASVPALTGRAGSGDPWADVGAWVAASEAAEVVDRCGLLAVPAGALRSPAPVDDPVIGVARWTPGAPRSAADLRVVDLSSMWAGPLAARVLADAGAEVIKVESTTRPDGARAIPAFYDWLHPEGQPCVTLDLAATSGRVALHDLVSGADVVIEGSRPRALKQLGCSPDDVVDRPGRVWLSVTGHGRCGPGRDRVGFGDDAAVAGGLVGWAGPDDPVLCADAIADPLTGIVGGRAVLDALATGGGVLLDAALARTAAWAAAGDVWAERPPWTARPAAAGGWELPLGGDVVPVANPPVPTGW